MYNSDSISLDLKDRFKEVLRASYDENLTPSEKLALAMAHEEMATEIRQGSSDVLQTPEDSVDSPSTTSGQG